MWEWIMLAVGCQALIAVVTFEVAFDFSADAKIRSLISEREYKSSFGHLTFLDSRPWDYALKENKRKLFLPMLKAIILWTILSSFFLIFTIPLLFIPQVSIMVIIIVIIGIVIIEIIYILCVYKFSLLGKERAKKIAEKEYKIWKEKHDRWRIEYLEALEMEKEERKCSVGKSRKHTKQS